MLRNNVRAPFAREIISLRTTPYAESFFRTYHGPLRQEFNELRAIVANVDIPTVGSIMKRTMNFNAVSSFVANPIEGNIPRENENVVTVVPLGFPWVTFNRQNENEIDHLSSIKDYRFCYKGIEKGKYKIKFFEQDSVISFIEELHNLAHLPVNSNIQNSLVIVPQQQRAACITLFCIVNEDIDWNDFVVKISYQNHQKLSTLWGFRSIDALPEGMFKIRFDVDPISFRNLLEMDFLMEFDGQMIDVAVEDNPWADDMAAYIVNFLSPY